METVKLKSDAHPSGYITVNKADAGRFEAKAPAKPKAKPKAKK